MPAAREHQQAAAADGELQERGIAAVKFRDDPRPGQFVRREPTVFPEMDFGEIAEARISERREERMLKINPPEHRVILHHGLARREIFHACQLADRLRHGRVFHDRQQHAAAFREASQRRDIRHGIGENQQWRIGRREQHRRVGGLARHDLHHLLERLLKGALEEIQRLRRVILRLGSEIDHRHLLDARRHEEGAVVEILLVAGEHELFAREAVRRFRCEDDTALAGRHVDFHGGGFRLTRPAHAELFALRFRRVEHAHPRAAVRRARSARRLKLRQELHPGVGRAFGLERFEHDLDALRPFVTLQRLGGRAFLQIAHEHDLPRAAELGVFVRIFQRLGGTDQRLIQPRRRPARRQRAHALQRLFHSCARAQPRPVVELQHRPQLAIKRKHRRRLLGPHVPQHRLDPRQCR